MAIACFAPSPLVAGIEELPGRIASCFVPQQDCEAEIVARLDAARRSIRVQAYGFSDRRILAALEAAASRGVDVQVILDRSNARAGHHAAAEVARRGIPVWLDTIPGIAHTKAIIVDEQLVIGGSYNYTASAQARNAETVLFLRGDGVARRFLENWEVRRAVAEVWTPVAKE